MHRCDRCPAKRALAVDAAQLEDTASQLLKRHGVAGVQAAVIDWRRSQTRQRRPGPAWPEAPVAVYLFQLASLSKPVAARLHALRRRRAGQRSSRRAHSPWRIEEPGRWGGAVGRLAPDRPLGAHCTTCPASPARNGHSSLELVSGRAEKWGYAAVESASEAGLGLCVFRRRISRAPAPPRVRARSEKALAPCGGRLTASWTARPDSEDLVDFGFDVPAGKTHAVGYRDGGRFSGRLWFPPFAAGAMGAAGGLGEWLCRLSRRTGTRGDGMHAVAKLMLERRKDLGAGAFMGARMGGGIFIRGVASGDPQEPGPLDAPSSRE